MTDPYLTAIGTADATSISLLGQDLAGDLMGQVSFGELAFWLVALRRPPPADEAGFDAIADRAVRAQRAAGLLVPGLGHPLHKAGDPRTPVLLRIAEDAGTRGPHLRLLQAVGRVHPAILGRTLPLNGAGVGGAALADLGFEPDTLRGFALLARAAGLLGHLAEEIRRPAGPGIYAGAGRAVRYAPPKS